MKLRFKKRYLWLFILILPAYCGYNIVTQPTDNWYSELPYEERPIHVVIGSHEYLIPRKYVDRPGRTWELKDTVVLFFFPNTHLSSTDPMFTDAGKQTGKGAISAIITINNKNLNTERVFQGRKRSLTKVEDRVAKYGLKNQLWFHGRTPTYDVYFKEKDGEVIDFLDCAPDEKNLPNPGCSDRIFLDDLDIKYRYDKSLLPQWREERRKFLQFLDNFKKENYTKNEHNPYVSFR